MKILLALLPVIAFLLILIYLDSFKLVRIPLLIWCFTWGILSAVGCYFLNSAVVDIFHTGHVEFGEFIAPFIEESVKIIFMIFIIIKGRVGFMIDGAIYGFAIGTGFAILENIFFLHELPEATNSLWLIRGFGTAIMHGGTVSVLAIIVMNTIGRRKRLSYAIIAGWVIAIVIHMFYNLFVFPPIVMMIMMLLIITGLELLVFRLGEIFLRDWLELEFDSEVKLLMMIQEGRFISTKSGKYLNNIKKRFEPLQVVDMLAYISLYLELSIRSKSNMILKENGLPVKKDPEIFDKLKELKILEKNIGFTGMKSLSPVLRISRRQLWKWALLK